MRHVTAAASVLLCMIAAGQATAQRATGRITSLPDGVPVVGAQVTVLDSAARERDRAVSDDRGLYAVRLGADAHTLRVVRIGFAPAQVRLGTAARDTSIDFRLAATPTQLDTAVTTGRVTPSDPNIAEFERRQRTAPGGKFISDSQLVKLGNTPFTSVLRSHIPGLTFISYRGQTLLRSGRGPGGLNDGSAANPADPRSPRGCWANIYFDGHAVYSGPPAVPPDIAALDTRSFAAVEFYQGGASLPLQFRNTQNACGTLMLWTRRRP